eukprot:gene10126-9934_t
MAARKMLVLTNRVPYPLRDGGNLAMNTMIEGYRKAGWQKDAHLVQRLEKVNDIMVAPFAIDVDE